MYKQCTLKKQTDLGERIQVSWIPVEHSVVGKIIGLKENGVWDEGWEVISSGSQVMSHEYLLKRSRDYVNHRKATDI